LQPKPKFTKILFIMRGYFKDADHKVFFGAVRQYKIPVFIFQSGQHFRNSP